MNSWIRWAKIKDECAELMQIHWVRCSWVYGYGAMHELRPTDQLTMKDVPRILCIYTYREPQCVPYLGYGFSFMLCICSTSQVFRLYGRPVFMYKYGGTCEWGFFHLVLHSCLLIHTNAHTYIHVYIYMYMSKKKKKLEN